MISLTFGEQVKIVLSRKGMTIKELAGLIEEKTGKKMSRQNLTQRLGRDNFQEQDMRMIAEILGCSFQLSILATAEAAEKASVIEEELPTEDELGRLEAKKARKEARREAREEEHTQAPERDITIGEFVDMMENPVMPETAEPVQEEVQEASAPEESAAAAEASEETAEETLEPAAEAVEETEASAEEAPEPSAEEAPEPEAATEPEAAEPAAEAAEPVKAETPQPVKAEAQEPARTGGLRGIFRKKEKAKNFEPIKKRADLDEDLVNGDVNPYTGHEYQSNSVRMHPKRIGYVQVYDRREHKWTDMTEWAFLGVEENKKAKLGKDYEPPIYLD